MAHVRKLVREAVANILLGNPQAVPATPVYPISEVAGRVFPNRPTPIWEVELPAICVYTKSEVATARDGDKIPKHYDRRLSLVVEILVSVETGFDDLIDTIAEKVEALLLHRWFLKDPVTSTETSDNLLMKATEIAFVGEDVHNVIASGQITFEVLYNTDVPFPGDLENFNTLAADYNIDEASGDGHVGPEAQDLVTGFNP